MEGTQLLSRSCQFRNMAGSINSLLSRIQVMFLTHANLTVAALRLLPSSAIVFLLRQMDNIHFYGVACYSEHLPRKWEIIHFFLPHLKLWTLHFWCFRIVQCPAVKGAVRSCCPSCWDTEPRANGDGKGGEIRIGVWFWSVDWTSSPKPELEASRGQQSSEHWSLGAGSCSDEQNQWASLCQL